MEEGSAVDLPETRKKEEQKVYIKKEKREVRRFTETWKKENQCSGSGSGFGSARIRNYLALRIRIRIQNY